MTEAEVVQELVGYTDLVLGGIGVLFTVVSAYVAGLNFFIRSAPPSARVVAFLFLTFVLALMVATLLGARQTHRSLIQRLRELGEGGELTAAGRGILENAQRYELAPGGAPPPGFNFAASLDEVVAAGLWGGLGLTYVALFLLTFVVRWGARAEGTA